MPISYIVLAAGAVLVLSFYTLAGRAAGLSITAVWSAATAYFVMAPVYSLRVSNSHDLAGLALFGIAGLVLARKSSPTKRLARTGAEVQDIERTPKVLVDLRSVLSDLMSSSEFGGRLKQMQIEVETSGLPSLRCSCEDAIRVLSDVLTEVLVEPQLRRISFCASRRPGVEVLFVDAHRVWPQTADGFAITIGKRDEDCEPGYFPGWPSYLSATWFDNGRSRIYQVSFKALISTRQPAIPIHGPVPGTTESE